MSATVADYRLEAQVGFLLRRATQRHVRIFQDNMPDGLTPTQFAALIRLAEVGQTSQNRLGRLTAMDGATIKGVVARLYAKGYVTVSPDPEDKRRTQVALSDTAAERIALLKDAGERISRETLAPLDATDCATLLRVLGLIS